MGLEGYRANLIPPLVCSMPHNRALTWILAPPCIDGETEARDQECYTVSLQGCNLDAGSGLLGSEPWSFHLPGLHFPVSDIVMRTADALPS